MRVVLVVSGVALFGFGFVGELLAGQREEIRRLAQTVDQLLVERNGRQGQ